MDLKKPPLWRENHTGHWLRLASQRFDARVLQLIAKNVELPLGLCNLAARGQLTASHVHITRYLSLEGLRLTGLASRAGMTKQAMGKLVDQCEAWGLVQRQRDPRDGRACNIFFTSTGHLWLQAFEQAVLQTELELHATIGSNVATVMSLGLEAYST